MMSFAGTGSYRAGGSGSLSSSSLSPLAPPFMVDKSIPKSNSVNPYPDVPMYGTYFDSTSQYWNPSSSVGSGQKLVVTESMVLNTTCSSSPGIYGYPGSQPSTTATDAYHVNSAAVDAYDPFSYDPFPNRISTTAEEGDKTFYSPYVPSAPAPYVPSAPAPQKDGYLSLGVGSGHGYDLLSNSTSAHLSGGGSLQVDHQQARIDDGDGKLNWGRYWGGANDIQQDKWSGYAQGFGSKNLGLPDLSTKQSPFLFDGSNKCQPSTDVNTHPFTDGSCNIRFPGNGGNRNHLKQDGSFDIFGGTYHLGNLAINRQDSMSISDFPREPTSVSVPISKEISSIQEPVSDSATDACGSQKANASSPGDHFSQSGFYVFGCSSTTSTNPATMSKSPYGDSSSFAESTLSALKLNSGSSVAAKKNIASVVYDSSYAVEPQPVTLKPSVIIRRPSSVISSSSKRGEMTDSQVKGKDATERSQVTSQNIRQFSSDGFHLEINDAQAGFSVDKVSGGTDAYNPAEDSPCWRGASSKRFSPFEVSEGITPDIPVANLVACRSFSAQEPEIKSLLVNTSDTKGSVFKKVTQSNDYEERSSPKSNPLRFDLNAVGGLQFVDDTCLSTKECCASNKSKTVSDHGIFLNKQPPYGPVQKQNSCAISNCGSQGSEKYPPVANEDFPGSPSGTGNKCASLPPGDNTRVEQSKPNKITESNVDVDVLLKTMTKLSEILRCYCFHKRAGVSEQHSTAIKHIIANLNATWLLMDGETTETMISSQKTSSWKFSHIANRSQVNGDEAVTAAAELVGPAEGLLYSVSAKDDIIGDVNMIEASKKILHLKLQEEEEMDPETLLYKSLWLEAEASLCAMTAKARLLRMKTEMKKTPGGTKDRENSSSSNIFTDVEGTDGLARLDKDLSAASEGQIPSGSQVNHFEVPGANQHEIPDTQANMNSTKFEGLKASGEGNPVSTCNVQSTDVEAAVMTRFQILKNRVQSSEGPTSEYEQAAGGDLDSTTLCPPGCDSDGTKTTCEPKGAVLSGYEAVMSRDFSALLNDGHSRSPGEDNYLPDRDSLSPRYQILARGIDNSDSLYNSRTSSTPDEQFDASHLLSNSVGVPVEGEASVMARFRILQNRVDPLNKYQTSGQLTGEAVEDGTDGVGLTKQQSNAPRCTFGPYPDLAEFEDGNSLWVDTDRSLSQPCTTPAIFDSWYGNGNGNGYDNGNGTDSSSSDWEHISKDDLRILRRLN